MRVLAAVLVGAFGYLLVGFLMRGLPQRLTMRPFAPGQRLRARRGQVWLNQAGVPVTPLQFWATSGAAGTAMFAVLVVATGGVWVVALVPAVGAALLPRLYYARQRRMLARRRLESWPEALRTLDGMIRSSMSLHQALVELGTSGPEPLRPTWTRYGQLSWTLDSRTALQVIREELAEPVSDRIIEDLMLAIEEGPATVLDILADLATSTTEDLQVVDRTQTAQLEAKLNARAVMVLPVVLLVILTLRDGPSRDFYSTTGGLVVIVVGSLLSVAGMAIVQRLGRLPDEPRVFSGAPRATGGGR